MPINIVYIYISYPQNRVSQIDLQKMSHPSIADTT